MKRTKKGFTLVELLVVIAILAILASVSVVGYTAFIDKAEESNANTLLAQVADYIYAEEISKDPYTVAVTEAELTAYLAEMEITATGFSINADGKTLSYNYDTTDTTKVVSVVIGA